MTVTQKLFSVTILGYKKPGMDEDEYHRYVSVVHAGHLKELLVKQRIVSYTMVCNNDVSIIQLTLTLLSAT